MAFTTLALGEEDRYVLSAPTTMATGEESGGGPTTMATGEEDSGLTTLAVGEEDGATLEASSIDNPFGAF